MQRLTPELIVAAYAEGLFPLGLSARSHVVRWMEPEARGVIPLDGFRISRSLRRSRRRGGFRFSADAAFGAVLAACADRPETWINPPIAQVFHELHALGLAHSVEVWEGEALAGGVYGLALGAAFFAESMVSRRTDGSKMALAELVARLRAGGYLLLDTQYLTPHLASLGGIELLRPTYRRRLAEALAARADPARAFGAAAPAGADGAVWRG